MSADCGEERAAEEGGIEISRQSEYFSQEFIPSTKFQFSHVIIYTLLKILSFFLEP
jgi:hypothetical protein